MAPEEKTSSNGEFPRQPLLSVERQIETNLETGRSQTRMFVKMYFEARDSGLLAALPAELWQTLCCLATYMDADGYCYPGQSRMARELGISRQQLNARLKRLMAFRFQDRPVIHVKKERRSEAGQWARNVYKVLPISGLGIFGETAAPASALRSARSDLKPVSTGLDTAAGSSRADAALADMNESPWKNEITPDVCVSPEALKVSEKLVNEFHHGIGRASDRASDKELRHAALLVAQHGEECARFIVSYAIQEARSTNFRMRHFGAVCSYVADALRAFTRRHTRLERERARIRRDRRDELAIAYERWKQERVEELKASMSSEELTALDAQVRQELLAQNGGRRPPALETLVRIRVGQHIADRNSLPMFAAWLDRRDEPVQRRLAASATTY